MDTSWLNHFKEFGLFTYPGNFLEYLRNELPDDIPTLGKLIRAQAMHRMTLINGNTGTNSDLRYGDVNRIPWWQQCEDDYLVTAAAMWAELFRREDAITLTRLPEHKLVVTCRFVSILMASAMKAKGIPARVRSGFAPYFNMPNKKSVDHWINQYWKEDEQRWVTIDVDGCLEDLSFNPYDMPDNTFDFPAQTWQGVRQGNLDGSNYWNAGGYEGLKPISWALIYDFHSLFNREIIYLHGAQLTADRFDQLDDAELKKIDHLAELMLDPDKNYKDLTRIWETNKSLRLLKGALL